MTDLQHKARRHLWMHFSQLGAFQRDEIPIMTRGEGCYVFDQHGRRYLDGLSGLFVVQVGHGRRELGEAAARQSAELGFFPVWGYGHEPAIELAARLAHLAPGDLNRVFFTTGGSEAVESAWKLAVAYFAAIGQPRRHKVISRYIAYHGTTFGALSITGVPSIKGIYEPLVPGAIKVANTDRYRCIDCSHLDGCTLRCADDIEQRILMEGPDTVAAVFLEPLQNSGGGFKPPAGYWQRVREICDRYGVLLVSDEVICAFGRLGTWFGGERYGYVPDIMTFAKGVTSGYAPLGGLIVSDRIVAPFLEDTKVFLHGITFGGHPVSCAVALANLDLMESEDVLGNVQRNMGSFDAVLQELRDIPIVGDVRGDGYYRAIELVRDQKTKAAFTSAESDRLLRGILSPRMFELGLYCRADDRGEPVITLAPALIAGEEEFAMIGSVLRSALSEATSAMHH
ncbi:MAG: aspartate aminotransferase family protein [Acidimicrobiales bacterium]